MSARRSLVKQQQPPAPTKPASTFAPGQAVVVLSGMCEGARGILGERWGSFAPGIPLWRADLGDNHEHAIREDFLEAVT